MNEPDIRVSPEKMHALGVRVLTKIGVPEDHARMTVDALPGPDRRGIESHGFARFAAYYVELPRQGRIKIDPDVRVVQDAPAAATVDGDGGLGFVASTFAMRLAIEKAQATGVGMVSVRNSSHYGPASPYAMMALDHGMIGGTMTTGYNGFVPPGGSRRVYGLNALSFAAPARPPQPPFVLDMATSVVAPRQFEIARRRGWRGPGGG